MQKISSYLYSNRIQTIINLDVSPLEWRIVYQRIVKLYKGLDNIIEIDVKNPEQKRLDILNFNIKFVISDLDNQEIYTADVDVNTGIKGIGKIIIPKEIFTGIVPQFLKYAVYYISDTGLETPLYGDTQFGLSGTIDLKGNEIPEELLTLIVDGGSASTEFGEGSILDGGLA